MLVVPVRLTICCAVACLGLSGIILGDGSPQWVTFIFVMWAISGVAFVYPYVPRSIDFNRAKKHGGKIVTKRLKQNQFETFWLRAESKIPSIRKMRNKYADYLHKNSAGLPFEHHKQARMAVWCALSLAPLCVIPLFVDHILAFGVLAAPLVVLYPLIQVSELKSKHQNAVREEAAFFMCYLTVMQGVGYTMYGAFEKLMNVPDLFGGIREGAKQVIKDVLFGTSQTDAIRKYAENHPLIEMKDFLYGYISKSGTVGGAPTYTEEKASQFFERYEETWKRYQTTAGMYTGMGVMASVMIPVMVSLMVFMVNPLVLNLVLYLGIFIGPVICTVLLLMISKMQPSTGAQIRIWRPCVPIGVVAGIVTMFILAQGHDDIWTAEPGIAISVGFAAAGLSNYIMIRKNLSGADEIDRALPEFLEDVTEQTLAGQSIIQSMKQQAYSNIYKGQFMLIMKRIVGRINGGMGLEESCARERHHSKYLGFTLFIISQLSVAGSSNSKLLGKITKFMARIVAVKVETANTLGMTAKMMLCAPLISVGMLHFMFNILAVGEISGFTDVIPDSFQGMTPLESDAGHQEKLGTMIALITCPLGLVLGKVSKFTTANTMSMVIISVLTAVSLIVVPDLVATFTG